MYKLKVKLFFSRNNIELRTFKKCDTYYDDDIFYMFSTNKVKIVLCRLIRIQHITYLPAVGQRQTIV